MVQTYGEQIQMSAQTSQMKIGVIKDRRRDYRVALVPNDIKKLINQKIMVTVQAGAGLEAGFTDLDYSSAGAKVVKSKKQVFANASMVLMAGVPSASCVRLAAKYKCSLAGNMYLSFRPRILYKLIRAKVTALGFESYCVNNEYPISKPIEICKAQFIANLSALQITKFSPTGLGRSFHPLTTKEHKTQVTILNDSVAAREITRIFLSMSANVTILENREPNVESLRADSKLNALKELNNCIFTVKPATHSDLENTMARTDVFIYTPLSPDANAKQVITDKMVRSMPKGSMIIDLLPMEGFISLTESNKEKINNRYFVFFHKKIRYQNISSLFAHSVSIAISSEISELLGEISKHNGLGLAIKENENIARSIITFDGKLTSSMVAKNLSIKKTDINKLIK